MSAARRHRLILFFSPLQRAAGWQCISPVKLPGSPGPRGAGRRPSPRNAGARGQPGRRGRARGGVGGRLRVRLPSSMLASCLPAGAGPRGASPGREAAALQARSHGEPDHLAELPSRGRDRSLPSLPAPARGEPASSLGGRLPAECRSSQPASKVEVTARPPPWAPRGWREPLAVELVLGDNGVHSSGPQAVFSVSTVAGNCTL